MKRCTASLSRYNTGKQARRRSFDRGGRCASRRIRSTNHVTKQTLSRGLRVNRSRHERGVVSAQQLQVDKEESLVSQPPILRSFTKAGIVEWATKLPPEDVLHELIFGIPAIVTDNSSRRVRRAIVLKRVAVKLI
jgi:hypothetical protein